MGFPRRRNSCGRFCSFQLCPLTVVSGGVRHMLHPRFPVPGCLASPRPPPGPARGLDIAVVPSVPHLRRAHDILHKFQHMQRPRWAARDRPSHTYKTRNQRLSACGIIRGQFRIITCSTLCTFIANGVGGNTSITQNPTKIRERAVTVLQIGLELCAPFRRPLSYFWTHYSGA